MESLNKITLTYKFGEDEWEFTFLLTEDDIDGYYGKNAICKNLFCFLDFERLAEDDDGFNQWLKDKYQKDAFDEYRRYML